MRTILERDRVESHLFICVFFSVLTVKAMLRQPVLGRLAPGLFQLANGLGRTVQHTVGLGGLFPFGAGLVLAMGPQVDRIGHAAKLWRGFAGGKRVLWVYDITALTQHEAQIIEQERQLQEILDYCPAAVSVVDEEGRILFHNRRLRNLLGYEQHELELFDTKRFWHDLDHRTRIIELLRTRGG